MAAAGKSDRFAWDVWLLAGLLSLLGVVVSVYLFILSGQTEIEGINGNPLLGAPGTVSYAIVGALILARYPRHVVGWILLAMSGLILVAFCSAMMHALVQIGRLNAQAFLVRLFEWLDDWAWIPLIVLPTTFLPLYYPTGTLPSRRWRIVSVTGVLGLLSIVLAVGGQPLLEAIGRSITNPTVVVKARAIAGSVLGFVALALPLAFLGSLASMAVRYRRAGRTERQQMKWLYYAVGTALISVVVGIWIPNAAAKGVSDFFYILFLFTVPMAIGIAILRYRLYDIDLIIRRTLVYGVVTAALATIYFGSVVLLQQLSAVLIGQQSPVIIVISTLLIAALFSPLRSRAQSFIDRRFYRAKYNAARTLTGFAKAARDEVDLDQLTAELLRVIEETMQPESISLWLRPRE